MLRREQSRSSQGDDAPAPRETGDVDAYFSWLGRDGLDELEQALTVLRGVPLLQDILDAMPIAVSILNEKGQVLLMNRPWGEFHGSGADCAFGKRHGEILGCMHAGEGPDGCGTSRYCERCGAAISILEAQRSQTQTTCEYRLARAVPPRGSAAKDFLVTSTAIQVQGRNFTVFAVQEVSPQGLPEMSSR
jgi:PAS domain-containing protein